MLANFSISFWGTFSYVSDLFYDGKNSDSAAELRIRMTQFSTTSDRTRPGMPC